MSQPRNIVFATNNAHKLEEIRRIMGDKWNVMSLNDIGCHDDIPETADTLRGNAEIKARYVKEHYGYKDAPAALPASIRRAMPEMVTIRPPIWLCCFTICRV